ncbi:hypothetical protein ABTZ59_00875 [Streptomyces sp. NPDC094034]|uniref:hypothetical protein n=1 Tax=Streptomyces sp. NPDC094034 TaxID=3155309 RepID=UPI0033234BDD
MKWIRDHCTTNDLELARVENFNDRYPEEQRSDFSLTRFTVGRSDSPDVDGWALPTGLPPAASQAARRAPGTPSSEHPSEDCVRALLSTESSPRPLRVHWILV